MNEDTTKNAGIDGVLTKYFQAQMPNPWPAWQAPETNGKLTRRSPWLNYSRWAVAACVAALLAGYLALAGFFPRERLRIDQNPSHEIGMSPKAPAPNR